MLWAFVNVIMLAWMKMELGLENKSRGVRAWLEASLSLDFSRVLIFSVGLSTQLMLGNLGSLVETSIVNAYRASGIAVRGRKPPADLASLDILLAFGFLTLMFLCSTLDTFIFIILAQTLIGARWRSSLSSLL